MRTREAAHPDAHAPARPRSRVVRARTWVRAPPRVLPDAVLKPSARSPRSSATKCGLEFLPTVFFSSGDRRLVTVTVSGVESARERERESERELSLWITLGHRLCTSGKWWCARNIQNLMGSRPPVRPLTTRAMCRAGEASPLFRVIDPRSAKWRSGSTSEADSRGTKLFRKRRSASANR